MVIVKTLIFWNVYKSTAYSKRIRIFLQTVLMLFILSFLYKYNEAYLQCDNPKISIYMYLNRAQYYLSVESVVTSGIAKGETASGKFWIPRCLSPCDRTGGSMCSWLLPVNSNFFLNHIVWNIHMTNYRVHYDKCFPVPYSRCIFSVARHSTHVLILALKLHMYIQSEWSFPILLVRAMKCSLNALFNSLI